MQVSSILGVEPLILRCGTPAKWTKGPEIAGYLRLGCRIVRRSRLVKRGARKIDRFGA